MKRLQLFMALAILTGMQSVYAVNIGQDVLVGAGAGAASLGVFYGTQSYLGQTEGTEGKALAASALAGVLLSAAVQAGVDGNFFAKLAAAALTFGLTKYIYEQSQGSTASQGSQPATAAASVL